MNSIIPFNGIQTFQRSIHLEEDFVNKNALNNYVTIASPVRTLKDTLTQIDNDSRAITWTGPYGGGKSALALILSAALSPKSVLHGQTLKILKNNPDVLSDLSGLNANGAWLVVPIVAQNRDPREQIREYLLNSIRSFWGRRLPAELKSIVQDTDVDAFTLIETLGSIKALKNRGVLILCDEMGRWLEGARNYPATLDFLQEFAERINRTDNRVTFVGVLHQSFDQYAASQGVTIQQNWSKVQGRYVDLPISLSANESVSLVAAALQPQTKLHNLTLCKKTLKAWPQADSKQVASALSQTWPLNPITAILLGPVSKSHFGQNERTIFNFLSSHEPYAFQTVFDHLLSDGQCYQPHHLWDYLDHNYHHLIRSSAISSQWTFIADAIETVKSKGSRAQINLTQTIGILNIFGSSANLQSTVDVLKLCTSGLSDKELDKDLAALSEWSIIVFRKYNQSWSIFEGSDLNIREEVTRITVPRTTQLSQQLNSINKPAVATRFYHNFGTLRWYPIQITSLDKDFEPDPAVITLVIPKSEADYVSVNRQVKQLGKTKGSIFACGVTPYDAHLNDLLKYQFQLNEIKRDNPILRSDRIARRELEAQLVDNWQAIEAKYWRLVQNAQWTVSGIKKTENLSLNQIATNMAMLQYKEAPIIHSEIINRDKPSSNGMKARKLLCQAMLNNEEDKDLGFSGFPAERGLYINVLQKTAIHKQNRRTNRYQFSTPSVKHDSHNILPAWKKIESFIKKSKSGVMSIEVLDNELAGTPFGIKTGVRSVLILATLLAYKSNVVFYIDDEYVPVVDDIVIDQFLRSPASIGIRYFELKGVAKDSLEKIASLLKEKGFDTVEVDPLPVARLLVAFAVRLPAWIRRTAKLSPTTKRVRDALLSSSDPYALIYESLPAAVGITLDEKSGTTTSKFANKVASAVQELNSAYSRYLDELERLLCESLKITRDELVDVSKSASSLKGLSGELRLDSFIARIGEFKDTEQWRESLAGLAANKAPRDWTDQDYDVAAFEITSMASRFSHLRLFQSSKNIKKQEKSVAIVVGSGRYANAALETMTVSKVNEEKMRPIVDEFHNLVRGNKLSKQQTLGLAAILLEDLLITETSE